MKLTILGTLAGVCRSVTATTVGQVINIATTFDFHVWAVVFPSYTLETVSSYSFILPVFHWNLESIWLYFYVPSCFYFELLGCDGQVFCLGYVWTVCLIQNACSYVFVWEKKSRTPSLKVLQKKKIKLHLG